MQPLSLSFT